MDQTSSDVETVRAAIRHTGYALVDGSWPAFERIVAEMQRLRDLVVDLENAAIEREEFREVGE